ncbi:MAG: MBL fold metallo-hydrolase [bacterium]
MIFRRLYHDRLAQASYLIACESTRQALIVDPVRDPGPYLEAAAREDVRIAFVTETHLHADFLSGAEALANAVGAELLLSVEGDAVSGMGRALRTGARPLREGDSVNVGAIRIDVRHSPGHTPEHLTFVVTDLAIGPLPVGLLSGDFLFAGDVGRPDLLERAVGVKGSMKDSARQLYRSLQALRTLPEYLQVWPGHGAGSACGKSLGAVPQTTLGYELRANWAFHSRDEQSFVEEALRDQPDPPAYFGRMKELNANGVPPMPVIEPRSEPELLKAVREGARVVDVRSSADFLSGHLPGSLSIPLSRTFLHWAGSLLDPRSEVVLVANPPVTHAARDAMYDLALIGFDRVLGALQPSVLRALAPDGLESIPIISAAELAAESDVRTILDVRNDAEWNAGHVPGAIHVPLSQLPARIAELRDAGPIAVHCQGGSRSAIAASFLRARGIAEITDVEGGYPAWLRATNAVARDER